MDIPHREPTTSRIQNDSIRIGSTMVIKHLRHQSWLAWWLRVDCRMHLLEPHPLHRRHSRWNRWLHHLMMFSVVPEVLHCIIIKASRCTLLCTPKHQPFALIIVSLLATLLVPVSLLWLKTCFIWLNCRSRVVRKSNWRCAETTPLSIS